MYKFLNAPFPFERNPVLEVSGIIGIGLFVTLFLIFFEPFGTDDFQRSNRTLFLLGYGIVVSIVFFTFRFILPLLFKDYFCDDNWNVSRHILWIFISFCFAFSGCYFYWAWYFQETPSAYGWWAFSGMAISIGIFPITGIIVADYIMLLRKSQNIVTALNKEMQGKKFANPNEVKIILEGELKNERLELSLDRLLYLRAANNYVEVVCRQDGTPSTALLRASLKNLQRQIDDSSIVRCHRSYIVNLRQIQRISGNAKGYTLFFDDCEHQIPVSRSHAKAVVPILGSLR